jgi:hypothetical protein
VEVVQTCEYAVILRTDRSVPLPHTRLISYQSQIYDDPVKVNSWKDLSQLA